ncbi:hypothetical protein F2981_09395 [Sinorhizobium meliloti]|nr:hypothetical protein [Sinorhizobium meliloti]
MATASADLQGITARLPHIAGLGADAIWIRPSSRRRCGTSLRRLELCRCRSYLRALEDFDALIARPPARLRVMIDLVLSHTPTSIPGSSKALQPQQCESGLVFWADSKPDGTRPTIGCRFSAVRLASGITPACNIICTTFSPRSRPQSA